MRVARVPAILVAIGGLAACSEPSQPASPSQPSYALVASPTCVASPTVIVSDEPGLTAALSGAHAGDVVAINGMIAVSSDVTISSSITLTCATPGSGLLVAPGATVSSLVRVLASFATVDGLVLDGSGAASDPYLALNDPGDIDGDGVTGNATDVRLTNNMVTCSSGDCAFFFATTNAVVSGNEFQSAGSFTGLQLQGGIDGSRIEHNTIVASAPSTGADFGGVRVRDGSNVVVADNVVRGPWAHAIAARNLTGGSIVANRLEPAGSPAAVLLLSVDGVAVDGNTLTGDGTSVAALEVDDSPGVVLSHNTISGSWVDAFVLVNTPDARVTDNVVACGSDECFFGSGAPGTLVAGNRFISGGSGTGVQLQAGTDGVRIENNEIIAIAPSSAMNFGGIRVRDGANVVISGNVVRGPWQNGLALADLADSRVEQNQVDGALRNGIRARSGGSILPVSMIHNVIRANRVTNVGAAGIFLTSACRNEVVWNNVQNSGGNAGVIFDAPTGANVFVGNGGAVIDNGSFDCSGDGAPDANIIGGPGSVLHGAPFTPPPNAADGGAGRLH